MEKNEKYEYPVFYLLDRIDSFTVTLQQFSKAERDYYLKLNLKKIGNICRLGNWLQLLYAKINSGCSSGYF